MRRERVVPPRRELDPVEVPVLPVVAVLPLDDRVPARPRDDVPRFAVVDLRVVPVAFRAPPDRVELPDLRAEVVLDDLRAPVEERVVLPDFAVAPDFRAPPVLLRAVVDRFVPPVAPALERLVVDLLAVVPFFAAERFVVDRPALADRVLLALAPRFAVLRL
ncbi:MAG TPA: hypothetical protein VFX39_05980, partial [Gemmatimonadaceae bacterium]|nr:hypothetical protein [Gemmatimonadaceae bacterium]